MRSLQRADVNEMAEALLADPEAPSRARTLAAAVVNRRRLLDLGARTSEAEMLQLAYRRRRGSLNIITLAYRA